MIEQLIEKNIRSVQLSAEYWMLLDLHQGWFQFFFDKYNLKNLSNRLKNLSFEEFFMPPYSNFFQHFLQLLGFDFRTSSSNFLHKQFVNNVPKISFNLFLSLFHLIRYFVCLEAKNNGKR